MLLAKLREEVLEANLELARKGMVIATFGNASGVARAEGLIVIKPSGVPCDGMRAEDLVVTDLHGKIIEGSLRPSSDFPTHAALYRAFPSVGGIAHTLRPGRGRGSRFRASEPLTRIIFTVPFR